jgi:hypothetical protein
MEPGNDGGIGSSGGAVAAAVIVAAVVLVMVGFGGGLAKPLVHPHVTMTQAPHSPAQSQG